VYHAGFDLLTQYTLETEPSRLFRILDIPEELSHISLAQLLLLMTNITPADSCFDYSFPRTALWAAYDLGSFILQIETSNHHFRYNHS
jgi:hypothetical protein